jgi:hypothetical protein
MRQTIVLNECMNRKNEEILRILTQESRKMELRIERYGLWKLSGAKQSFKKVLGVFVEFLSGGELWCERIGTLVKIGNCSGIFGVFRVVRT